MGTNAAGGAAVAAPRASRIRKVALFLGIVWSIGGAFLFLLVSLAWVTARLSDVQPQSAVLSPSSAAVAHCQEVVKALPMPSPGLNARHGTMYQAWRAGYLLGQRDARVTLGQAPPDEIAKMAQESHAIAQALEIPDLPLPKSGPTLTGLSEFTNSLAADPQCIGAALESRHSRRHSELFRFGAVVGFAAVQRLFVDSTGLDPEIQTYGSAAEVPPELWRPLLEKFGPGTDPRQAVSSVLDRIELHIREKD